MIKIPFVAAALLAAATIVIPRPAHAQDMKKDVAVKPADSPSKVLLDSWNEIGRKLIAMAEDFPEDKYDFKPTPAQRTFAEQLLHAANANYFFTDAALGKKMPAEEDPKRSDYKTKADVVAFVKKAFADGAAAIQAKGDKGMSDLLVDPFAHQKMRVLDMAYGFIEHSGEHYGQLVVYYRVSGLVPPESRPKK
ncbi:MAG: DinB family protein [Candidatus Sulfotelmatobacter sp.]